MKDPFQRWIGLFSFTGSKKAGVPPQLMGRKPNQKVRKPLTHRAKTWVKQLVPLLQDRSLDKLTMDEIADMAGKSKSTVYTYFSTKEEIYEVIIQLILKDMQDLTFPEAIKGDNMEQVLRIMLVKISEGIDGLTIHFLEQIQLHFPDVWSMIAHFADMLLINIKLIYETGMEQGTFRRSNVELLLALDRFFVMSVMTDTEQFDRQGISLNDLVREYIELRLNALRPD